MKKIILLLVLLLAVYIIFFMKDDRPDLNGRWAIDTAMVDGADLAKLDKGYTILDSLGFLESDEVRPNALLINRNTFYLNLVNQKEVNGRISFPHRDTLVMECNNPAFNGRYQIDIDTLPDKFAGCLDINVKLTSAGNRVIITMHQRVVDRNEWLRDNFNNSKSHKGHI